jgi:D-alanyl-D-alanine carboxypeptidase
MAEILPVSAVEQDATDRLQHVLDDLVGTLGNLAALVGIEVHGRRRRYFSAGYADLQQTERATEKHLFQIGSQTKTVVAVALLLLERQGLIQLDSRVDHYLDLPIDRRITVRHLLMNTSGLGEYSMAIPPERLDPRLPLEPRDLVALALPQGQVFEPGARFDYSNTGWVIAAMLIEKVAARPYAKVVRDAIGRPLGLRDTYIGAEAPTNRMIHGYLRSGATSEFIDIAGTYHWAFGAGDAVSNLDDMLELFGALATESTRIGVGLTDLTASVVKPSDTPYYPLSLGAQYGLGIERRAWAGAEVWGHPGSTIACSSGSWCDIARGVTITSCVTHAVTMPIAADFDIRYPRAQLFSMALNTAYTLASEGKA